MKPDNPGFDRIAQFRNTAFNLQKRKEMNVIHLGESNCKMKTVTLTITFLESDAQQLGNVPQFLC